MKLHSIKNSLLIIKDGWIDNIRLLKWESLEKILLVTLKGTKESLSNLFKYFGIFFILFLYFKESLSEYFPVTLISSFIVFLIILSARASVNLKNFKYYIEYLKFVFAYIAIYLIYITAEKYLDINLFIIPVLWLLFVMDSRLEIFNFFRSFHKALKMLIINFPIFVLIKIILFSLINIIEVTNFLLSYFLPNSMELIDSFLLTILYVILTFFVVLITKLYIKFCYEQFKFYN